MFSVKSFGADVFISRLVRPVADVACNFNFYVKNNVRHMKLHTNKMPVYVISQILILHFVT